MIKDDKGLRYIVETKTARFCELILFERKHDYSGKIWNTAYSNLETEYSLFRESLLKRNCKQFVVEKHDLKALVNIYQNVVKKTNAEVDPNTINWYKKVISELSQNEINILNQLSEKVNEKGMEL